MSAKRLAGGVKLTPSAVRAERVMAHHERGQFSQGEIRRNYLAGGGVPLHHIAEQGHIGRVREGAGRKGEYGGTAPSEATRAAQLRPLAGRASLPPISPDDVMTCSERGVVYDDKGNVTHEGGLFVTRDGRVVRTTHMGDKPLPLRGRPNSRKPAMRTITIEDRVADVAREQGIPLTKQNRQHILDYLARKDANIVRS